MEGSYNAINRDREHKRIKDIADIYALLWFSDVKIAQLKAHLRSIYSEEKSRKIVRGFEEKEIDKVSNIIGIRASEIKRVLSELR